MALPREEDRSLQSSRGDHKVKARAQKVLEFSSASWSGFVWVRGLLFNLGGSWGLVVLYCCHPTPFPSLSSFYTAWHLGWGGNVLRKLLCTYMEMQLDTEKQLRLLLPSPGARCCAGL